MLKSKILTLIYFINIFKNKHFLNKNFIVTYACPICLMNKR